MTPVGQPVPLTVWRDGRDQAITVTIAEWPSYMPGGGIMNAHMAEAMIQKAPDPGVKLAPLTDAARKKYGLDPKLAGVLVSSVEPDCEARDLGIVEGDVVMTVQGAPVATPEDVRLTVQKAHEQHRPFSPCSLRAGAAPAGCRYRWAVPNRSCCGRRGPVDLPAETTAILPQSRRGSSSGALHDAARDPVVTAKVVSKRHWRSYGTEPLASGAEALDEPFTEFPSWFLRIECDRCGKVQMLNEAHARWRARSLRDIMRDIIARMRHDGIGWLAGKAELLTGIEGVSSRPVRRIVLREG